MLRHQTLLGILLSLLCAVATAQTAAPAQKDDNTVRAESRLVLVDAVVTDKKGGYVTDLSLKDFRVWEDNKEVAVKNFSYEASPGSPQRERYLVLFFDNSTMSFSQRAAAKDAATKFIRANAGPKQLMAVINYGGALQISQNFTSNADRLVQVVNSQTGTPVGLGSTNSSASAATEVTADTSLAATAITSLSPSEIDFGTRSVLLALRSLAKNLSAIPGRKTLVFLTAGFQLSSDRWPELEAVISQCNKANVAIYPLDARGLVAPGSTKLSIPGFRPQKSSARFVPAGYRPGATRLLPAYWQSRPPAQSGGTGGTGGTGSTGSSGGTGTRAPAPPPNFPSTPPVRTGPPRTPGGILIPPTTIVPTDNQAVLETLARGTGGFVIKNTNDLVAGLEKIGQEQNQYYILAFTPAVSKEGSCHALRVKVERGGLDVRSRSGYCNLKSIDLLAGTPQEKELQARVDSQQGGIAPAGLSMPFFYTAPNTAKVNLAAEIPSSVWKFSNEKGKFHAVANVLGVAYKQDGSIAARFSDSVTLDLDNKKEVEDISKKPYRYEKQFLIASGDYTLKVVFSGGGENFAKIESRLNVEPFQQGQFSLSSVALSTEIVDLQSNPALLSQALLDDRTPLVYDGYQIVPSIMKRFKRSDTPILYAEIYEPLLMGTDAPTVMVQYQILDRGTGQVKLDTGMFKPQVPIKVGNPVITVGLKMRSDKLAPGAYRVLFRASDSAGKTTMDRSADFDVVN